MNDFVLAPAALGDLEHIWDYYAIELQNPEAADRLRDEMFEAFRKLVKTPRLGHFRSDLSKEPLRFWQVRRHLVVYRSEKRPLEIVRVLHGARDVQAILGDTPAPP
jgi:plasmid stabilization system protein ParE